MTPASRAYRPAQTLATRARLRHQQERGRSSARRRPASPRRARAFRVWVASPGHLCAAAFGRGRVQTIGRRSSGPRPLERHRVHPAISVLSPMRPNSSEIFRENATRRPGCPGGTAVSCSYRYGSAGCPRSDEGDSVSSQRMFLSRRGAGDSLMRSRALSAEATHENRPCARFSRAAVRFWSRGPFMTNADRRVLQIGAFAAAPVASERVVLGGSGCSFEESGTEKGM